MRADSSARVVVRTVLIVVAVVLTLYLIWLLRKPLSWIFLATLIAIALSGPVNFLSRRMPRGLAIALVYFLVLLAPFLLALAVIPPIVTQATNLADDLPRYAQDTQEFLQENERLRDLDEKYDIGTKLQQEAGKLPARVGDAASVLGDLGIGVVNSVFALITILILSIFLVANGRRWADWLVRQQPRERAVRLERTINNIARAVGNYFAGALLQALIAGMTTYIVLLILGVPFRAPLAVLLGLFSLIPQVGATIASVIIGLVTLFTDFPTATIVWAIWAVAYQQLENNLIQPQIQKRAVDVHPFLVIVSVLFGATLFGVLGALIAVPIAASIQIAVREIWEYRAELRSAEGGEQLELEPAPPREPPSADPPPAPV